MIIAAAQTIPQDGNLAANIADHCRLAAQAAAKGARLIIFPEMSLTGYMLDGASQHAIAANDARLDVLKDTARNNNIMMIAGAPVRIADKLYIGAFIFHLDGTMDTYTKIYLHTGEEKFYEPGIDNKLLFSLDGQRISVAICADITNPQHPADAAERNTTLYTASIFYTPKGLPEAYEQLSSYAKQYGMHVLMANFGGPSCNIDTASKSASWNKNGELVAQATEPGEALLLLEL